MARCKFCGAETQTYESGPPICVACLSKRPSREEILAILREQLAVAQKRRDEASERFNLIIRDNPREISLAYNANSVQEASNAYRFALDDVLGAFRTLNDFLLTDTIPPDLDLRNVPRAKTIRNPKSRPARPAPQKL